MNYSSGILYNAENFIQQSNPKIRDNLETGILVQKMTGLLICRLLALDVFVYKVLQMDKIGHVPQRLHALAGFGLMVFPATVGIQYHIWGYICDCELVFSLLKICF